jgi:hypothetical protein
MRSIEGAAARNAHCSASSGGAVSGFPVVTRLPPAPKELVDHRQDWQFRPYYQVVVPGYLVRSASLEQLQWCGLLDGFLATGIRGVLDLQEVSKNDPRIAKQRRFVPLHVSMDDGHAPTFEKMIEVLNLYERPEYRPLGAHCYAGVGRTGVVVAILLALFHEVNVEEALDNARQCGMSNQEQEDFVRAFVAEFKEGRIKRIHIEGERFQWSRAPRRGR